MGIIARQTLKGTIYSYVGAGLGFLNVALIMPHIFSSAEIGLTHIIISISVIFGQLGSLGFTNVTTRLFPYFRNEELKHNGFGFLMLAVGLIGFLLCLIIYFIIKPYLIAENISKSPLFVTYIYLLLPLIFITIFSNLLDAYNRVLFNASFGVFVREFLLRVLNFVGIALFYFNILDFHGFIHYYTFAYAVPVLLILLLLLYNKRFSIKPAFSFLKRPLKREIVSVAIFGLFTGFSAIAAMHIDRYMINHFCSLSETGIYSIAFFFGTIVHLPGRALYRISTTIITEAFKAKDYEIINNIYIKSTINQLIAGLLAFLLIWGNIDNVLYFLPQEYAHGKFVVLYISLTYLLIMGAGISSEIISFSQYYRQYSFIMVFLLFLIVLFNLLLIPKFGINGAATASLLAYLGYFLVKYIFIFLKFGFQPFSLKHVLIICIGIFAYGISLLMPNVTNVFLNLIIKTTVLVLFFSVPIYFSGVSNEINNIINKWLGVFKKTESKK